MLNTVSIILCVIVGGCLKDIGEVVFSSTLSNKKDMGGKR